MIVGDSQSVVTPDVSLTFEQGTLNGTVTSSLEGHAPLAGATVSLCDSGYLGCFYTLPTDAQGRYSFADLPRSYYIVGAAQPDYKMLYYPGETSAERATQIFVTGGQTKTADIVLPYLLGTLTGRVTSSAAGNPGVAGASVTLCGPHQACDTTVQTDAQGNYVFDRVLARNDYHVFFPAFGTLTAEWWNDKPTMAYSAIVVVASGQTTSGIDAVLSPDPNDHGLAVAVPPTVDGTPQVGAYATFSGGTWTPGASAVTRQWLRNGQPIAGATDSRYLVVPNDLGAVLTIQLTGTRAGFRAATQTSAPSAKVAAAPLTVGDPTITGTAQVGKTLTTHTGTWGPGTVAFTYQWVASGQPIAGATATTFVPTSAEFGKTVAVTVTGTKAGYATTSATSAALGIGAGALTAGTPSISGTPKVGVPLTAKVGTWSPLPVDFSYVWKSNGTTVSGATSSTFTPRASDVGNTITVTVTGSKSGYLSITKTSAKTAAVAVGTLTAVTPTIAGTAKVGSTLTAKVGAWGPAPVTFTYQWKRDGVAIAGATGSTRVLTSKDLTARMSVTVTGSKSGFTSLTKTSATTLKVTAK